MITPESGTQEIKDPDAPGGASRSADRRLTQSYEWTLDASGAGQSSS